MQIIGFSGRKQSGKTTAAEYAELLWGGGDKVMKMSFASRLKEIIRWCFVPAGIHLDFDDEKDKSMLLPCGRTVRDLLQVVGTDMFRGLWSDVWVNAFRSKIQFYGDGRPRVVYQKEGARECSKVLVPDVRFPNEVKCIQDMGGIVIRLTRCPHPADDHESETALDHYTDDDTSMYGRSWDHRVLIKQRGLGFDYIVDNYNMTIDEKNAVIDKILRDRGLI